MAIRHYWSMAAAAVGFRLVLVLFGGDLHLASRPEVSTPLTSIRRLAEGYWLKQASISPYLGLLDIMFIFIADFIAAMLIRATGHRLHISRNRGLKSLELTEAMSNSGLAPLAAFGYVMATHLTLYPAILIVPIILLLGYGPDTPPTKVFRLKISSASKTEVSDYHRFSSSRDVQRFMWKPVFYFVLWMLFWSCYVLLMSSIILNKVGGLQEMFEKTFGFILTVKDLSPNIGVLWYFFAEVFDFFRSFFLIVFNMNIVFMVLPLAIRLKHHPCFLAFVYTAIVAMLKSYPSGTGNANFYFATGLAYTCLQTVLVVESVSSMIKHDRKLRPLGTA
uniref:Uncharacterized protein n=1 Tax=Oryza punctata TaxID=4537 RepID=A0A0E0JRJ8_ORYPU